jgi:hypothetical protein
LTDPEHPTADFGHQDAASVWPAVGLRAFHGGEAGSDGLYGIADREAESYAAHEKTAPVTMLGSIGRSCGEADENSQGALWPVVTQPERFVAIPTSPSARTTPG